MSSGTQHPKIKPSGLKVKAVVLSEDNNEVKVGNARAWSAFRLVATFSLFGALAILILGTAQSDVGLLGCDAEGVASCQNIWSGEWAKLFGSVPLAGLGAGFYMIAILLCWTDAPPLAHLRKPLAAAILVACVWCVGIQTFVLETFCANCCLAHLGACVAALYLWFLRNGVVVTTGFKPALTFGLATGVVLAAGAPWGGAAHNERTVFAPIQADQISLLEVKNGNLYLLGKKEFTLPTHSLPRLGQENASRAMVILMNYACPHCVQLGRQMREVMSELCSEDVAVYFVPVATKPEVAEAQATLLSLWKSAPLVHDEVVERLSLGLIELTAVGIRMDVERVTSAKMADRWLDKESIEKARQQVVLHGRVLKEAASARGLKSLPQMWFPQGAEQGVASDSGHYFQLIERHLGVARISEPKVEMAVRDIKLGRTPASGRLWQKLSVSNRGAGQLRIAGVEMPANWRTRQSFPIEVPGGQTAEIEVELRSPAQEGEWKDFVKVLTNATEAASIATFRGTAIRAWAQENTQIELAEVSEGGIGAPETQPLLARDDFAWDNFRFEMQGYRASWTSEERDAIRFVPEERLPLGGHLGRLAVPVNWKGSTLNWSVPPLDISVVVHVRATVVITPQRVVLPPLRLTKALDYTIAVRPRDGKTCLSPAVGLSPTMVEAGVTVTVSAPDARQGVEVTLRFPAHFEPTAHIGGQVMVRTGAKNSAVAQLPIELSGRRRTAALARTVPSQSSIFSQVQQLPNP